MVENTVNTYELKLSNQAKLYEQKELNFNEKIVFLEESKTTDEARV